MRAWGRIVPAAIAAGLMSAPASAGDAYPTEAPVAQYAVAGRDAEVALARSAAPASVSNDADVLVLGPKGYETAVKGKNGFACLVLRSWTAGFNDPVFWNPHIRGPACLNAAAVRSVLPHVLERARWAQAGVSKADMLAQTKAQLSSHTYVMPEAGAMCFMMSKDAYLSDDGGHHWHPHVMFYVGNTKGSDWGADLPGSPVMAGPMDPEPVTVFYVPVKKWSDGTAEAMDMK